MNKFLFLVLAAGTLFASNSFAQEQQPELSRDQKIAIAKREIREAIVKIKNCIDQDRQFPEICMEVVDDLLTK